MHPDLATLLEHARADHRAEVQLGLAGVPGPAPAT